MNHLFLKGGGAEDVIALLVNSLNNKLYNLVCASLNKNRNVTNKLSCSDFEIIVGGRAVPNNDEVVGRNVLVCPHLNITLKDAKSEYAVRKSEYRSYFTNTLNQNTSFSTERAQIDYLLDELCKDCVLSDVQTKARKHVISELIHEKVNALL
jgi:fructose-specific component phosphotransferase system IIB-like protein